MKGAVGGGTKATRRLPVFVSPEELEFVGEEETSHKQILTIFNPYNFKIRFKGVICALSNILVFKLQAMELQ